jgi:3-methyladenine DNA glycosylase AlkC
MEQIALDQGQLLVNLFPEVQHRAAELRVPRFLDRMKAGARVLWDLYGAELFTACPKWESDTARGWAAFAVSLIPAGLDQRLSLAREFADDHHFAVREWAWLGVRPAVVEAPKTTLSFLVPWVDDTSCRIRRFCSEVTRPKGVWSRHIVELKAEPWLGLPILSALSTAPERYVRDSVANWLNDVSATSGEWVEETCAEWETMHGDAVAYVCRRARRSLQTSPSRFRRACFSTRSFHVITSSPSRPTS